MSKASEIKAAIKAIVDADPNYPMNVVVQSIEGETCTVKFASGFITSDVRLNATVTDGEDYLLLTPLEGSDVTILSIDGTLSNLVVIKIDQLKKFEFFQSGLKVAFDSEDKKVQIKNEAVNLKDLFSGFADIIKILKVGVLAPNAPSSTVTPDVLTAVEQLEAKINQLLK
ncbi:hypothetical protein FNO01nite_30550 [Flavobacterium noncentrifugens]|uniref:Uncharacterized protein n=1 Tax=Flavobacterium noncentrifugens TaxID=1128970 RepID=A0A1G9BW88_9FLAO|nr:hypothetical protein [Flavobacterium noncentrifugens]GEP52383.1 hypothetical protein FNO01nite_30550 [Flavobacterium noncentrifugens]SDK43434.1 hypothetical protein SAMN04487935_3369 [Flavobacterium noncentrifugens]